MTDDTLRVTATEAALSLIAALQRKYGELMFHQSGGCCDGSAPMCYPAGDLILGAADVYLGSLEIEESPAVPVYISRPQFEYWSHTHLTIDVVPGRGAGFSLEAPTGRRFIVRSRLFTDEETLRLAAGHDAAAPAG